MGRYSVMERHKRHTEIFSPVGLIRNLIQIKKIKVHQMRPANFLEFQNQAKQSVFSQIPYTQVKQLQYLACDHYHVSLKLSHSDAEFTTGASDNSNQIFMAKIAPSASKSLISKDKVNDISSMLDHMPLLDRQ